jgi:hypothetical protein
MMEEKNVERPPSLDTMPSPWSVRLPPGSVRRINQLTLKVVTQDSHENFFKCKTTTPLRKIMTDLCNRNSVAIDLVRFVFDGRS